jgi:O-antigen ligase
VADRIDALGRAAIVALAFAVPVSTALANVCLALVALCWLGGGQYRGKLRIGLDNPVALAALLLYAWLLVSLLQVDAYGPDQATYLRKYADLPLIAVFAWFCRDPRWRSLALAGFAAAMLLTLALSFAAAAGLLPSAGWLRATPDNAVVFKLHITHGLLMALAAMLFMLYAREARRHGLRALWTIAAALALYNTLFMVQGRTGYLVIAAFIVLVFAVRFGLRGMLLASVLVAGAAALVYQVSPALQQRVDLAVTQFSQWDPSRAVNETDSIGRRLEFFSASLDIARERPWLGHGVGAFPSTYRAHVEGSSRLPSVNPHNEYLLLAVQAGLPAVALFVYLLGRMLAEARRLPSARDRMLGFALPIWLAVGCLVNSLLIDHTESLLFTLLAGVLFASAGAVVSRSPVDGGFSDDR